MVGLSISHPFDTVKSNIQANTRLSWRALTNPKVLYKGIGPPLVGMAFEKSVVFGTFHAAYRLTPSSFSNELRIASAGAISGFAASFVVGPYERLKI